MRFVSYVITSVKVRSMASICRSRTNPATGRTEWILEDETYDFYQEIARSAYGDMLHDTERNVMFHRAIKNVIADVRKQGEAIHVLDIGTGTGLLAMMAAAAGADRVTACEAFRPVAETAKKIIAANGFQDKIQLIEKRSTDMSEDDLPNGKANILVAEVFDTELIGEGALRTFIEAHGRLLTSSARVIPKSATVYAQIINCDVASRWANAQPLCVQTSKGDPILIRPPDSVLKCPGSAAVHDLQLDQLPPSTFTPLSDPVPIFKFDFEQPDKLTYDDSSQVEVSVLTDSTAHAIMWWWELDMDGTGRVILSMKPDYGKRAEKQWRDHWMQAIYYLPKPLAVWKGSPIWLIATHDEHSFWFDVQLDPHALQSLSRAPACDCGHHLVCSRGNLGYFNDESRYQRFVNCLEKVVPGKTCLCISDCSRLPLFALKLGAKKVFVLQNGQFYHRIFDDYAQANGIAVGQSLVLISNISELPEKIQCVFGDPFFFHALLPWHNFHFWYKVDEARRSGLLHDNCSVLPKFAHLKGIALQFKDLWKIRAPVNNVEGFDLRHFDAIVQKAIELCDSQIEPHSLWEYPSIALSRPVCVATYDLASGIPQENVLSKMSKLPVEHPGQLNAMAFWMDWDLECGDGQSVFISTGLALEQCELGQEPQWNWYCRQGVYFFPYPFHEVTVDSEEKNAVCVRSVFYPHTGDIGFDISLGSTTC